MITLEDLRISINNLIEAQREMAELEDQLKSKKEQVRFLKEEVVPSAMTELGLKEFVLDNGQKVTIKNEVYASIKPEDREAFNWLYENGFGGIVKSVISIDVPKGEFENAKELTELAERLGFSFESKETVHPMTLKAFLKEQLRAGADIPLDAFNAQPVFTTVIKG